MTRHFAGALLLCLTAACAEQPAPSAPSIIPNTSSISSTDYEAIDLGTLGGSSMAPKAIDKKAVVHGFGRDAAFQPQLWRWEDGSLSSVSTLPSPASHQAVSEGGVAAGVIHPCSGCDPARAVYVLREGVLTQFDLGGSFETFVRVVTDDGSVLAGVGNGVVLWRDDVRHDLGSLDTASTSFTQALSMNDRFQVVGSSSATNHRYHRGYVWEDGQMRALGLLAETVCADDPAMFCHFNFAEDINEHGDIVGTSSDASGQERPVLWLNGGAPQELPILPGEFAAAFRINDRRQIVVGSFGRWFMWEAGAVQELGSLGGGGTRVTGLNNRGEVIGTSRTAAGQDHAFVWRDGIMVDLGAGPGGINATPFAINDRGDVIGVYTTSDFQERPILWRRR